MTSIFELMEEYELKLILANQFHAQSLATGT